MMSISEADPEIAGDERDDPILDVGDAAEIRPCWAPNHADDLITLVQQKLGQIGTILTRDTGNKCRSRHVSSPDQETCRG